ncbi:MAG: hypothetical protein IT316_11930 [Anaerolineales bacterium]|nr:hypothetical protein [Anaerolineales bacterium]
MKSMVAGVTTAFIGDYYEWRGSAAASVKYYYAGGMRVAMRTGGGAPKYLLGDYLGSMSALVNGDGTGGQAQGYMPWGETRYGGVGTEYQFTGQYRLAALGLDYYGARWYDSSLGRFAQADSIVPDSQNSLDYDRYSYVRNNPIRLVDPSGHKACDNEGDSDCNGGYGGYYYGMSFVDRIKSGFHVEFIGEWTERNKDLVYLALYFAGSALAAKTTAVDMFSQAFNAIFNATSQAPFKFQWNSNCALCMGANAYTHGSNWIEFSNLSTNSQNAINNIIHELGHAFDWAVYRAVGKDLMPRNRIGEIQQFWRPAGDNPSPRNDVNQYGFAGERRNSLWHQNPYGSAHEEFADTFLGWVFDRWERNAGGYSGTAIGRIDFMNKYMGVWVNTAAMR